MGIRARQAIADQNVPYSYFQIEPGCETVVRFIVSDDLGVVDWAGHSPRFRLYSPFHDSMVLLEITDPERCRFEENGFWSLRLTAEETERIPRGGHTFTLEHRQDQEDYQMGLRGAVSCKRRPQHLVGVAG